ncbi:MULTISPECIES: tetratricopeptide repeat protein [unclassified Massilia]|uniref:YfgM family protein n=1 Tax=unclassified Massilia TaxID=2609279 RepID=UPI001B810F16|nr:MULTISPECIES: tetratricopeptide repeat protein [unclassified Massilia]MBQ5942940.1 tetratricopeptide repeat protein [Massilia sp. AB1]MBQ5966024.1 tetratricopeptide repeat protein [Massilia sp. ZL223]
MAYDLEEQEQIATFKAFWSKYGNIITWVLILALGSYAAYNFWNSHKRTQAAEASALYDDLQKSLEAKDNAKVQRVAGDIKTKYEGTAYAQMAALAGAKAAFDASDLKTTKAHLQWAIDHGNDEYKSVAKLRMAGVLLDEKAYDEAIKLLGTDFLPQFAAEVNDRKGDVLVAQNKLAEARQAYVAALAAMDKNNPGRQLVQIKLESIGGTAPAEPKAAEQKAAA